MIKNLFNAKVLVCFIAGAATTLAFSPFDYFLVVFVGLAILLYCWSLSNAKQAFACGLAFGLGLYLFGVSWVYNSLNVYGGMPVWMGAIAVFGFAFLLALLIALLGFWANLLLTTRASRIVAFPFVWVLAEWIKSWLFTGFPWLDVGYSQTSTWLFAYAPIGGVYLVGWVVACYSACFIGVCFRESRVLSGCSLIVLLIASYAVQSIDWTQDTKRRVQVGIVQANVPIEEKWMASNSQEISQHYFRETRRLNAKKSLDLVVWPETALPLTYQNIDSDLWPVMVPDNVSLITGILDRPNSQEIYNAAVLQCANGGRRSVYRKRHLVPFGEYLPLRFAFQWVLDYLNFPMSDLSSGSEDVTLKCENTPEFSLSICYEDAFAAEWQQRIGDAGVLINISEDAWFGDSIAPHQRVQMAKMRAREFSKPLVRSANTGPSVIVNHKGHILVQTKQFVKAAMSYEVVPQKGQTLFQRFGNWIITCAFIGIFLIVLITRTKWRGQVQQNTPPHR